MRQKILLLKLAFKIARMFRKDFYKVLKAEIGDSKLYPQQNYSSCMGRANAMINDSMKRALNYYACSIAAHRFNEHSEDHSKEIVELETELSTKEFESATSTRGFWMM